MKNTSMQDHADSNSNSNPNPSSNPIYNHSSLTSNSNPSSTDRTIGSSNGNGNGNGNGVSSDTSITNRGGEKYGSSGGGGGGDQHVLCCGCGSRKVDDLNMIPPGYKFLPTDEELIVHYLRKKADRQPLPPNNIHDVDIYDYEPEMLLEMYKPPAGAHSYFFTPRKKKYRNGQRPNRAAGKGYWKAYGVDDGILSNGVEVGLKRALVFYMGKPPNGVKTNWIMKEYKVPNPPPIAPNASDSMRLDDSILCKIYMKIKKDKTRTPTHDHQHPHHHQSTTNTCLDFPCQHHHPATTTNYTGFNHPSHAVNNITNPPQPSPTCNTIPVPPFQIKRLGMNSPPPMPPQVLDYDDLRAWVSRPPPSNPSTSAMPFQDYDFDLREVVSSQPLPLPPQPLIESINPSMADSSLSSMPLRDYDLIELVSLQPLPPLDESNPPTMSPKMCNNGNARTVTSITEMCSDGNASNEKHKVGADQGCNSCGLQVECSE